MRKSFPNKKIRYLLNRTYWNMRGRCGNKNRPDYKFYGGRGIKCLWLKFEDFYNDMVDEYRIGLELDRINNNGNYCKKNCRWTTRKVQLNNYSRNHLLKYKGKSKTIAEWSEFLGMRRGTLSCRINKYGWSIKESIETKTLKRKDWNNKISHKKQLYAKSS